MSTNRGSMRAIRDAWSLVAVCVCVHFKESPLYYKRRARDQRGVGIRTCGSVNVICTTYRSGKAGLGASLFGGVFTVHYITHMDMWNAGAVGVSACIMLMSRLFLSCVCQQPRCCSSSPWSAWLATLPLPCSPRPSRALPLYLDWLWPRPWLA